jgi:hypothetical protein
MLFIPSAIIPSMQDLILGISYQSRSSDGLEQTLGEKVCIVSSNLNRIKRLTQTDEIASNMIHQQELKCLMECTGKIIDEITHEIQYSHREEILGSRIIGDFYNALRKFQEIQRFIYNPDNCFIQIYDKSRIVDHVKDLELENLEQSMNDINNVFKNITRVVDEQCPMIDNIGSNIDLIGKYNQKTTKILVQTEKKSRYRRIMYFWSLLVLGLLMIIFVLLKLIM